MTRLIDADALKEIFDKDEYERVRNEYQSGYNDGLLHAEVVADDLPTVDAVPVRHGKWIRDEFGARCSGCGLYAYRDKFDKPWESPYCPICGARMDEK